MTQKLKDDLYIIKVQRPKCNKLLIYSLCNKIPTTLIPDEGPLKAALGNRLQASFLCSLDRNGFCVLQEVFPSSKSNR